ncbi:hypothetical protein M409DRAFT_15756 [Zasmidium cellare ATCC 36951]|uniref:Mid2 domain-containing protein n=1 Tax=Zasmidium cellare ATCC 36951 TaxID=1080233 RepID=A0A6A6D343_ZASCE|nr:uncharacterized protein M409DRAFT_15756 [Zasmidium cellare ATCC 36951]KAF2173475.1 hypothetical protein M409DRAFT_15756 [Zasmidium cellare ATCC 36951]
MDTAISAETTDFSAAFASSTQFELSDTSLATAPLTRPPQSSTTATIATTITSTRDDGQLETIQSTVYQVADPTASPATNTELASPGGSTMSSGAVVAVAICVTLAAVTGLLLTWHFVRRHRKRKAREAAEDEGQIAEKDGSERSELCGASRPHEAPNNIAHEMYVPPYEILGEPIEGPVEPMKLVPDVEYSHTSGDSQVVEDGYAKSVSSDGRFWKRKWLNALPWFKRRSRSR